MSPNSGVSINILEMYGGSKFLEMYGGSKFLEMYGGS